MPLPDQTPKLPKLPFLVGDAALLGAAWFIAAGAPHPWTTGAIVGVAGCVAAGAILGAVPFLTDYARRQDEALDDRQRGLEALARTVATSAEQISIAAQGLQEITELAHKNLKHAEQLPHKLQEKIAGLQARVAGERDLEKEELEKELAALRASETDRIEAAVDRLAQAAVEWTKAEAAAHRRLAAIALEREAATAPPPSPDAPPADAAARKGELAAAPAPEIEGAADRPSGEGETALPAPVAKAARKPRAPRKPKAEDALPPPPADVPAAQPELAVFAPPAPSEFSQVEPDEAAPAVSADGATRLLVTAYIGIGNRLFIRGDGPGLAWDKGVPLQFVSIGKWRWEAPDAAAPVRYKLFKNDEVECVALGEQSLEAGRQQEVTAGF
jgi:hypothetical protein